ncbi:unnamed protein product, partial [marine sediment metagenome]
GTGPEPVSHSHPHCLCVLYPVFINIDNLDVQNQWNRATPYDRYYEKQELEWFSMANELDLVWN